MRKNKKGFTLAELTISLAVISIIAVAVMTLTATTLDKTYDRRISFLYKNECQNLLNCFIASSFTMPDDELNVEKFEEKLDFYYELEREGETYKSHEFATEETQTITYRFVYDEVFNFNTDVVESYVIECKVFYTLTQVTLSIKVIEAENNATLYEMIDVCVKEVL